MSDEADFLRGNGPLGGPRRDPETGLPCGRPNHAREPDVDKPAPVPDGQMSLLEEIA